MHVHNQFCIRIALSDLPIQFHTIMNNNDAIFLGSHFISNIKDALGIGEWVETSPFLKKTLINFTKPDVMNITVIVYFIIFRIASILYTSNSIRY
ncbi:hypothetical protein SEES0695_13543 [Salmonella enterica subsp. enterica serovar Soerenga]|nr:hypothetical protein SEES0695_13543 [Salmonella enterica subsp. enterica serovar Soerenga str. 695]